MIIRTFCLLLIISSCAKPNCDEFAYQDDFRDAFIAGAGYKKCTVLEINEIDTIINSQHFFDSKGRTDSVIHLMNTPSSTYYEVNKYNKTDSAPKSIRRFKLYDENGQFVQPRLIFETFFKNGKEYEFHYGNDGMLSYSEFTNNNEQSHIYRKYFSNDSTILYYTLYSYNQNRRMILSEKFNRDSSKIGHRVFEYNYSNSIPSKETTFVHDTLYMELQRTFEDCYYVSEEIDLNYNRQVESKILNSFNSDGLPKSFRIEGYPESENTLWIYQYEGKQVTNAMNEWVSLVRMFSWGLESPPQVLNLNQGVAICETRD